MILIMVLKIMNLSHIAQHATRGSEQETSRCPTRAYSFEFFPPQTLEASFRLWETVQMLAPLKPGFVSVTYGAGGTTRKLTHEAVTTIGKTTGLNVAAHLTCVDASRAETLEIAEILCRCRRDRNRRPARRCAEGRRTRFTPIPRGFANSVELIEALAETGKFNLRVGAYPEPHPEAADHRPDVAWLKRKIDAGASLGDHAVLLRGRDLLPLPRCLREGGHRRADHARHPADRELGRRPSKFAARCGTQIPAWMDEAFDKATRDGREELLATALCTELCDS